MPSLTPQREAAAELTAANRPEAESVFAPPSPEPAPQPEPAPVASTQRVAGQSVQCVDVPVGAGVEHYCATSAGPVARWDTAAVSVELTGLTDAPDPGAFAVPGG